MLSASSSARISEPNPPAPSIHARSEDVLPRRFGRYQLFDRIGRGGMADIFLARAATGLGGDRLAVVKQIHPALSQDPTFASMFIEEAKLCAGLQHGNVVQVLDLGRENGLLYIVMEYVEGFDLHQLLVRCSRARVPLPLEHALFLITEVLEGLDFAHRATDVRGVSLGIVHRDVSPSNVLASFEGEVKLCDFGIARAANREDTSDRGHGRIVGKSAYMSPEQARGEAIDARADVFAAGIVLWELAAGRRLYRGSEQEMLEQAQRAEIPAVPERGLPDQPRLQAILDRALVVDRDRRWASAAEFREAIEAYAIANRLHGSQIRFGNFLSEHFGSEYIHDRRARERAARALEMGPPVLLVPIATATEIAPEDSNRRGPQRAAEEERPSEEASAVVRRAAPAESAARTAAESKTTTETDRSVDASVSLVKGRSATWPIALALALLTLTVIAIVFSR